MIIYDEAKKNIKIAIFSEPDNILNIIENEIEDKGYKLVEYTKIEKLNKDIIRGKVKILLCPVDSNLNLNDINLKKCKIIQYDKRNLNLDTLMTEVYYNEIIVEKQEEIDYKEYKLEIVANLVENISHKIQSNLLVLGASQDIIKMISEDKKQSNEKKQILNNLYMKNEDALDKSNTLLQLISNATSISNESIMSSDEIIEIINLILDETLKENQKSLNITQKIRKNSYICGPLNDVIFVICRIIKYLIENEQEILSLEITEDAENWYFNIFVQDDKNTEFFDKIKKYVIYVKNVNVRYQVDKICLLIKKVK